MKLLRFEHAQSAGGAAWGVAVGADADRVLPLDHKEYEGFDRLLERAAIAASPVPRRRPCRWRRCACCRRYRTTPASIASA